MTPSPRWNPAAPLPDPPAVTADDRRAVLERGALTLTLVVLPLLNTALLTLVLVLVVW